MERNRGEASEPRGGAGCSEAAGCAGGADFRGNRDSEVAVDYGGCLPQWEKLPVSHESSLKSALERSR